MSRFLVCTHPITGHVNPAIEIVRKLVERGHDVRVYTGRKFQPKVEAVGATFVLMTKAYDYDDSNYDKAFSGRGKLTGFNQIKFDFKEVFIRPGVDQRQDLLAILKEWPADVVLSDPGFVGAKLMYDLGELEAWAVFDISVLGLPSVDVPPFGLGRLPDYSTLGKVKNRALSFMWNEVTHATRPVALVTQGTVATNIEELIAPTLQAMVNEDVLVVATTGGKTLSGPIPANARVASFIPFNQLMPHVSVMVTNGGYGGVTIALANGVPVVCGGTTEDKPEVGNRVAYAGVGINLKTNAPTPDQIRNAVKQVLSDASYRTKARQMQAAYAKHDAPAEAAVLLEQLATARKPVLRERNNVWAATDRLKLATA